MSAATAPNARVSRQPVRFARVARAAGVPITWLALTYGLWWLSDRLLQIGPLDRATFGWLVLIPMWAVTPTLAGIAWQGLWDRESRLAAISIGTVIGITAAVLFWLATVPSGCQFGSASTPFDAIGRSLLVGVVIGSGLASICLLAFTLLRTGASLLAAFVSGALATLGLGLGTAVLATAVVMGGSACLPPPGWTSGGGSLAGVASEDAI